MIFAGRYAIIVWEILSRGGNVMDFEEEYKKNRTAMKKCKKTETLIFIVFALNIAVAGFYLLLSS